MFDWNLLQHMNNIVVHGGDCKKLIVTFDADLFYQGKYSFESDQSSNIKISILQVFKDRLVLNRYFSIKYRVPTKVSPRSSTE